MYLPLFIRAKLYDSYNFNLHKAVDSYKMVQ